MTLSPHVAAYNERYTVRSPADLQRDIARVITNRRLAALEYEERNLYIHHPTRLCPACDEVVRLQVAVDTYRERRTRCCPECGILEADRHCDGELRVLFEEAGR